MGGVARKVMSKPKIVQQVQPAPTPTAPEVSQAQATSSIQRGKGRTSMIITGARGLGDNDKTKIKISTLGI